jgi:hypothetical protein
MSVADILTLALLILREVLFGSPDIAARFAKIGDTACQIL